MALVLFSPTLPTGRPARPGSGMRSVNLTDSGRAILRNLLNGDEGRVLEGDIPVLLEIFEADPRDTGIAMLIAAIRSHPEGMHVRLA